MLGARLQGAISPSPASTLPCIAYKRTKAAPPMQHSTTTAAAAAAHGAPAVYCYSGPGAGARSLLSTLHSLRQALVPAVKVASLDAAELLAGGWQEGCLALVMPGGADLPYCKHLNGRGNALITEYVQGGGSYLGLCAGAYFACACVEFEPGSRLEVVGDRELGFFPGTAAGSIYRGFEYESEDGAVAAPLRFLRLDGGGAGGAAPGPAAAQQEQQRQEGGSGGPGFVGAQWDQCIDYVNGGPGFVLPDGSPVAPRLGEQLDVQQQQWQPGQSQVAGVEVLAVYPDHSHTAAALVCCVGSGSGRAVLCSSHPELHPSWLGGRQPPSGSSSSSSISSSSSSNNSGGGPAPRVDVVSNRTAAACALAADWSSEEHVQRLQAALGAGQQQRWHFWRSLLVAAGLQPWLVA